MYNMFTSSMWILFAGGKMESMVTRLQTISDMKRKSTTENALSKYTGNVLYKALLGALAEVELINQVARKYAHISGWYKF